MAMTHINVKQMGIALLNLSVDVFYAILACNFCIIQALAEVLKSIDSNIQRIHEAAAAQGGMYTSDQRNTLQ